MRNALENYRTDKFPGFDVSTALYSARLETKIFPEGEAIPLKIAKAVQELKFHDCLVDAVHISIDYGWDAYNDAPSTTEVFGISVDSFAFKDATYIHEKVSEIVQEFVSTHKRVVTYEEI